MANPILFALVIQKAVAVEVQNLRRVLLPPPLNLAKILIPRKLADMHLLFGAQNIEPQGVTRKIFHNKDLPALLAS